MNFSGALFALMRGHKVRRHHWSGYWIYDKENNNIIIHTHDGKELFLKDTPDIIYTLSNCACDDWEIIKEW